jgi:hypothetical protein
MLINLLIYISLASPLKSTGGQLYGGCMGPRASPGGLLGHWDAEREAVTKLICATRSSQ